MVIVYFSGGHQRKKHLYEGEMYSKNDLQQKLVEDFPDANLKFAKNKQTDYLVYPDNSNGPSKSSEKVANLAKPIFFSAFLRLLFENKIKTKTKTNTNTNTKSKSKLEPEKRKSTKTKAKTIPKTKVSKATIKTDEYPNLKDFSSILRGVKRFQVASSYKFFPSDIMKKAIKELKNRFPEHNFSNQELKGIEKALDDGYEEIDSMLMECFDEYVKILFNERPKYKPRNTRKLPSIKTLRKGILYLPEIDSYESMMVNAKYVNVNLHIVPFEETRKNALEDLKQVFPRHQFSAVEQLEIEMALKEGYEEWNAMWLDKLYDYVYKGLYNKSMGRVVWLS